MGLELEINLELEIDLKLEIESERDLFIGIEIYMESKFIRVEIGIESIKSKWKLELIWVGNWEVDRFDFGIVLMNILV